MIQPHSPQFQLLSANNLLNRGNRNCTAMVQPKNNVGSNNTLHMSQISTLGPDHLSSQSRNMLPDQSSASAATMVAQYNSCKNNQTASMSHTSRHYKSINENQKQHKSQSSSSTEVAQAAGLQAVREGATAAHYKGGINEAQSKISRASGNQGNRSEMIYKNSSGKVGLIDAGVMGVGHNHSQTSLKSQRSGGRGVTNQHHQNFLHKAQHIAGGSNSAISPANRSAANPKEQSFFQQQSFSSHGQREGEHQNRAGLVAQGRATGSSAGSSEKYLAKQPQHQQQSSNQTVPHQIIVNGFHHKPSSAIMSSHAGHHGHGSTARAPHTSQSGRPKSNSGSGSAQFKGSGHDSTISKSKNATSGQIQAVMGLMISGGTHSSLSGTDSQLRGANNSRKKHNQSNASKMSHYTTDQKGKTVRHHDSHNHHLHHTSGNATPAPQSTGGHSSSHGSALNSMRNYSGSLQKAPMAASTSIYKSQRGHHYSKISSRASKPAGQEHVLHNAKTMKALGVSGTVASESTGLSRSGRSGEGDRTGGAHHTSGAVHSSFSASGIPRHPKLMHQKHSGAVGNHHNASGRLVLPNQKSQGGGSLTQNQTPNHLIYSNSHNNLSKQRQYYNSNQHQQTLHDPHHQPPGTLNSSQNLDTSICQVGGSGSTAYQDVHDNVAAHHLPSGIAIHSSSDHAASKRGRQQQLFNNNQKIQRFDFRDYDSEEKLRIKTTTGTSGPDPVHNTFDGAFDKSVELRATKVGGDKKDNGQESVVIGHEAPDARRRAVSGAQDANLTDLKSGHISQLRESTQKEVTHNISEVVETSQKLLSQSKSTGKVTHSERTTEMTHAGSHTSPLGQTVQIDDGKMKHLQQMIQNVKFRSNEMRMAQDRKAEGEEAVQGKGAAKATEAAHAYDRAGEESKPKQQQIRSLQIQIPADGGEERADGQGERKDNSVRAPGESGRKERSEGGQTSHSLQCGEENLLPSTEKKDAHSKISAQMIPKSGGAVGLMKTSTHLISNMQANKNIFLGKLPCNSTRNNSRHSHQILDDDFQLLFSKDKSSGRLRPEKGGSEFAGANPSENATDQNQETPKILYKDRSSITNRILQEKVNFEKRTSPEKQSSKIKAKKPGSSGKKEQTSSGKKQPQRSALMHRGTSQGPPVTKNRDNRIAAEDLVPSANSTTKTTAAQAKGGSVSRLHGSSGAHAAAQANQSATAPSSTLSKCIGIRSGSESNVKTNSSNIWNAVAAATTTGLSNMEKISHNMHDQRGLGIQPAHKIIIPNDDPTKTSSKRTGIVRAYAANTNQGLVRNYNEDRVSIITNLLPPKSRTDIAPDKWPRCSYFGIYDGHGGSLCADFLRDNLHQYVIMEPCFPANPKDAIVRGFEKAEKAFMEKIYNPQTKELKDKSGSCAIVVLIVQEICYVANVGDSRAVLSCEGGQKVYPLSLDHKPGEDCETKRIRAAGGQIYYRTTKNEVVQYDENKVDKVQQMTLAGPLRVLPGRLSVARTFGDPEAKIPELGGNPHVVIHSPEVKSFQIKKDHDFIVLGCDGIFDKMSNGDVVMCVWKAAHDNKYHQNVKGQAQDVHKLCGMGVEYILKNSLLRRSLDNVTVVVIGFSNLKHEVFGHQPAALQFKSDGDSGTENQLKAQSQVYASSQQLQHKKQNIVANSHRERDPKASTKAQDKQESGKTLERNRSANLPRDSCARQGISMKYQQIAQSNKKSQETASKGGRKHSAVGHSSAHAGQEGSDRSSKKRALTSSSSGGQKEKKQSPTGSCSAEATGSQSLQIKKQYQNLHGNVSTGQLHKAHVSYTARPSHSGQTQKEGAKPPLSSHNNLAKYNNIQNQFGSQNTTPTNSMGLKASSSHMIGSMHINSQKNSLKAPRQSMGNQSLH